MIIDIFTLLKKHLKKILDPSEERENETETIENILKGINFRGSNLWVLIFAIFIASLGLNVNSTAVIIGAMLISPLMGPIMGIGLGIGINDFELIKKAFRNLAIATLFGILTSTLYFLLSPLNEARSELLARTTPTIYDVLIAFFGGMAGCLKYQIQRQCNSGSSHCYSTNASFMHGRFRTRQRQPDLFLWCFLSLHDKLCLHCLCNNIRSKAHALF